MTCLMIPDIHGHLAELDRVLDLADRSCGRDVPIVFLGDLVDRGPDSAGVIQRLVDGLDQGRDWTILLGNHDQLFLEFLDGGNPATPKGLSWLDARMGGRETLRSYGVRSADDEIDRDDVARAVPQTHIEFLRSRPLMHQIPGLCFVHAGIRPGVALEQQAEEDLLWIRQPFLDDTRDHGVLVVHGHTAIKAPEHHGNRVNLDAGAGWGRELVLGIWEDGEMGLLTEGGRTALTPND